MGNTFKTGNYVNGIFQDTSNNIGIGAAPSGTYKFEITGTSKVSGVLTLGATLSNGTYTYTLPAATGTLALVGGAGVGTVTSVAALTIGTSGTDLSSTVANSTTTPVITLNVPTASAANRGALSSADWTTFNNKQSALTNPVLASGTWTSGYLPKINGTYTIGNSLVYDTGSEIIVGTTTIASGFSTFAQIEASGTTGGILINSATNNIGRLIFTNNNTSGGEGLIRYIGSTQNMEFWTNATQKLTLTSSGNLGIGVTPESWFSGYKVLQVNNFSVASYLNSSVYLGHNYYTNTSGNDIYRNNGFATNYAQFNGNHAWYTAPTGTAGNAITFTQAMTLTAAGYLGIGTASPVSFFSIGTYGSAGKYIDSSTLPTTPSNYLITLAPPSTTGYYGGGIGWSEGSNTAAGINAYDDGAGGALGLSFATGTNSGLTEKMRITSGGNVLIGTTSDSGYKLDVNGTGRFSGAVTITTALGLLVQSSSEATIRLNNTGGGTEWRLNSYTNGNLYFQSAAGATNAVNFTPAGAATFSSSIAATTGTFSGDVTLGGTKSIFGTAASYVNFGYPTETGGSSISISSVTRAGSPFAMSFNSNNGYSFANSTASAVWLSIASTGAATFSSSVTAGGNISIYTGGYPALNLGVNSSNQFTWIYDNPNAQLLLQYNGGTRLTIASGGAATFSSSVNVNGILQVKSTSSSPSIWAGGYGGGITILADNATSNRYLDLSIVDSVGAIAAQGIRITNGGNVLIGTTTDDTVNKLQVNGNIAINKGAGNTAIFDTNNTRLSLALGGTANFTNFSGMILVNSYQTGSFQILVCGGGSTASVYLLGGAMGTLAYNAGINGYTYTITAAATSTYNFTAFRTRPDA